MIETMWWRVRGPSLLLAMASALGCAMAQQGAVGQTQRPRLLVFITVDQMRADYFQRFAADLTGGLRRLHDGGAFYPLGFQDHAITETAPGHSTTLSGRFPVHTGITMNSLGVNDVPNAEVIGGLKGESASPFRFRGTTLVDWMRAANSETRWLSVSRKDRGAILPVGKSKGDVYWYDRMGGFTTSRYYMKSLPSWVLSFNSALPANGYVGKPWTLLLDPSRYPEPDSVGLEANASGGDYAFPHVVPSDPDRAMAVLPNFPYMDELTLQFALRGVSELGLGTTRGRTDVLAVSLSSTDAVGHRWGPDSREIHDQIVRVDRYLGAFLDSLIALRGADNLIVALTGDHGVTPLPMLRSQIYPNENAKRVNIDQPWAAFRQKLLAQRIDTSAVALEKGMVIVTNPGAFSAARADVDGLLRDFARDLMRVQGVQRVDLMTDLATADTTRDTIARRWLHMFTPQSEVRLMVSLEPYSYWLSSKSPTHGSPNDPDANVPIVFWGAGVQPGVHSEAARVVDIAPTLAAILGVRPLEPIDGQVLRAVVAQP